MGWWCLVAYFPDFGVGAGGVVVVVTGNSYVYGKGRE